MKYLDLPLIAEYIANPIMGDRQFSNIFPGAVLPDDNYFNDIAIIIPLKAIYEKRRFRIFIRLVACNFRLLESHSLTIPTIPACNPGEETHSED